MKNACRTPSAATDQVVQEAEAAEALAKHAPGRAAGDSPPDQLGVGHDRVGAEVREVLGLRGRTGEPRQGLPRRRCGESGAALVEQEQAVLAHRAREPPRAGHGPRRRESGSALEKQQPRQLGVRLLRRHDLAGEDAQLLAVRAVVVERHREPVVGEDKAGDAVDGLGHEEPLSSGGCCAAR